MAQKEGRWNPKRVLTALGRIGYEPAAAVMDIVDNSVSWEASKVAVNLTVGPGTSAGRGRPRLVLGAVEIIDNGTGMTEEALDNALALGSDDDLYEAQTLSKFGLGLKSAASSLGARLMIVTRSGSGDCLTAIMDHDTIAAAGAYVYELRTATADEASELDAVAAGSFGTLVRIDKIHAQAMPSPAEILERLRDRLGVTYGMFIGGKIPGRPTLEVLLDGTPIPAIDPLFGDEAQANGDLDDLSWDGQSVSWLVRPQTVQLDETGNVTARVSATQLPHPPTRALDGGPSQAETRREYFIGAGNYGFYVYRNGRLIAWAESLGFVPLDQDLYSFRGRFEIESDADEVLNIDVTKSRLHLSELARSQMTPIAGEAVAKSRRAWKRAKSIVQERTNDNPHDAVNEELDRISELDLKTEELEEAIETPEERERLRERRNRVNRRNPATQEESERLRTFAQRVQLVDYLNNDQLWERAHDPSHGLFVRVNTAHRFYREVLGSDGSDPVLARVLDLFFFALARAEYQFVYRSNLTQEQAELAMEEFREFFGSELSEVVRQVDVRRLLGRE